MLGERSVSVKSRYINSALSSIYGHADGVMLRPGRIDYVIPHHDPAAPRRLDIVKIGGIHRYLTTIMTMLQPTRARRRRFRE
jgi:hypothetical protein